MKEDGALVGRGADEGRGGGGSNTQAMLTPPALFITAEQENANHQTKPLNQGNVVSKRMEVLAIKR